MADIKNFEKMKHLIRSVKYFFYFAFLTTLIIIALVLTGMADGNIGNMFEGGYSAIWKMAAFFALVSAVYPKIGFIHKTVATDRTWADSRDIINSYMEDHHFHLESESGQIVTFRHHSVVSRLSRMLEDRITITFNENGGFEMEGLRKDVFRLATGLEYKLNPQQE